MVLETQFRAIKDSLKCQPTPASGCAGRSCILRALGPPHAPRMWPCCQKAGSLLEVQPRAALSNWDNTSWPRAGAAASKARYSVQFPKALCWKVSVPGKCQPMPHCLALGHWLQCVQPGHTAHNAHCRPFLPQLSCICSMEGSKGTDVWKGRAPVRPCSISLCIIPGQQESIALQEPYSRAELHGLSAIATHSSIKGTDRGQEDPVPPTRHLMGDASHGHTHLPEHSPRSAIHLVPRWLSPDGHSSHPIQTTEYKLPGTKQSKDSSPVCRHSPNCSYGKGSEWPGGWEGCTTAAHSPAGGFRR